MNLLVYQFHDHTDDIQDNTELDFDIRASYWLKWK